MDQFDQPFSGNATKFDGLTISPPRPTQITPTGVATAVAATVLTVMSLGVAVVFAISGWQRVTGFAVFVVLSSLGMAFLGGVMLIQLPRQRRLLCEGLAVSASVTACQNARGGAQLSYTFETEDGQHVRGSGRSDRRREVGEGIRILYLPQNPKQNIPCPLDLYRIPIPRNSRG